MMIPIQRLLFFTIFIALPGVTHAAPSDETGANAVEVAPVDFSKVVHAYLRAKFKGEAESFYADAVLLLPGHEYLKPDYGIAPDGDRGKAEVATREQMLKLDRSDALSVPPERIEKVIGAMEITVVRIANDEGYEIAGEDGKGKKMSMPSRAGDMVAVARFKEHDDFLAFLFRREGDSWKLVAEYLD